MGTEELQISKLDAARRQLETAVRLYFSEADPVSIHTLTGAAYQVLSDINKRRDGTPMLKETILTTIKPDRVDEARALLNAGINFFKHADHDPDAIYLFKPSQTEMLLFDACIKYRDLTNEQVPTLAVYQVWFWLGPGAELVDTTQARVMTRIRASFPGATRQSFFREVIPITASLEAFEVGPLTTKPL